MSFKCRVDMACKSLGRLFLVQQIFLAYRPMVRSSTCIHRSNVVPAVSVSGESRLWHFKGSTHWLEENYCDVDIVSIVNKRG